MSDQIREKTDKGSIKSITLSSSSAEADRQSLDALLPSCLLENLPDAVIAQNAEGVISSWNPAAERFFGYSAPEIKGQPFSILLPPETAHALPRMLEKITKEQLLEVFDTEVVRKDGSRVPGSVTLFPMKNASGKILGALSIIRDITRRKKIEADLWESDEQFRKLATAYSPSLLGVRRHGKQDGLRQPCL